MRSYYWFHLHLLFILIFSLTNSGSVELEGTEYPILVIAADSDQTGIVHLVDFETNDLSGWDGIGITGNAEVVVADQYVHEGMYSGAATIYDASDDGNGVRLQIYRRFTHPEDPINLPDEAFYSAWYFIPAAFEGNNNIMQWKQAYQDAPDHQTRKKTFSVTLRDMVPHLSSKIDQDGNFTISTNVDISNIPVPAGRWFLLECYYRWSTSPDGAVICWLDGRQILRAEPVTTQSAHANWLSYPRQWTVNNYGVSEQIPSTHSIYIDDVALSTERVSPVDIPASSLKLFLPITVQIK